MVHVTAIRVLITVLMFPVLWARENGEFLKLKLTTRKNGEEGSDRPVYYEETMPIGSMGLEYLPTFTINFSQMYMGVSKNRGVSPQIIH